MDNKDIILTADDNDSLNKLIDETIKKGYLISSQPYTCENNKLNQVMCKPINIEQETTLAAIIQVVFLAIFVIGVIFLIA